MADMNALPPEMLVNVFSYCDHASLKSLRLVCKKHQELTTTMVFEHFYMAGFDKDLENLRLLSNSPLAKHVKTFTLYSDVLPPWQDTPEDFQQWVMKIDFRLKMMNAQMHERKASQQSSVQIVTRKSARSSGDLRNQFSQKQLSAGWAEFQRIR